MVNFIHFYAVGEDSIFEYSLCVSDDNECYYCRTYEIGAAHQ